MLRPGSAQTPSVEARQTTSNLDRNDPSIANIYTMRSLVRGSRDYEDDEFNAAIDVRRSAQVAGWSGFVKTGAKIRSRSRDFNDTQLSYAANANWSLTGYTGQPDIPNVVAAYRANGTSDGNYDYGYFLDPAKVRAASDTLIARGLLAPLTTNAFNSTYNDYSANEDVIAGYGMAQLTRNRLTILAGVRLERSSAKFKTFRITDGVPTAIAPRRTRTDWLPGVHGRYDLDRKTTVRAAYSETLARPTFNQLNPRETRSTTSDTISRGNIDLQPVFSRNYDLAIERYLGGDSYLSGGVFRKDFKRNVYRSTQSIVFEGDLTRVTEPRNARGGRVTGVELAIDSRFKFLPAPFDGLGATLNYTHTSSSLDSGLPALAGVKLPLLDQVADTFNASLRFERGRIRLRAALHHRSSTLFELATDNPVALARYEAPSTTIDFTGSYKLNRGFSVYFELANLTNEPSWGYNGDKNLRLDYSEYTDWNGVVGVRWNL